MSDWDRTPAGERYRRQWQNRRYARLHPKSKRVRHLCTSCWRPGHNCRTCRERDPRDLEV